MARANPNRVAYGDAVLDRFIEVGVPSALKDDHDLFEAAHSAFTAAQQSVEKAEDAYDTAAKKLAGLDAKRDGTLTTLADKLPSAGLAKRAAPFASFSKHSPSKLCSLAYAAQTGAVRDLVAAIEEADPPAEIASLCAKCTTENDAVDAALKKLTAPVAVLAEARAKRDAIIPEWEKHLRRLKDASKVVFRDVPGRLEMVFAEPDAMQVPKPRRRVKKTSPPDGAAPPAPVTPKKKPRRK